MDFFEISSKYVNSLTKGERGLFDYVIKHMDEIKNKSIREVSAACFVSTTTFLRFVRKIGYTGYSEFTTVLKFTVKAKPKNTQASYVVDQKKYREEYLKNMIESVRVMESKKIELICHELAKKSRIVFFAKGISKQVATYAKYIYTVSGFEVLFPEDHLYRQTALVNLKEDDLIFVITYTGDDVELIKIVEKIKAKKDNQHRIISITGADNNPIQNLSDINLYIFTDEIERNSVDITSRVSSIVLMELILYQYFEGHKDIKKRK